MADVPESGYRPVVSDCDKPEGHSMVVVDLTGLWAYNVVVCEHCAFAEQVERD